VSLKELEESKEQSPSVDCPCRGWTTLADVHTAGDTAREYHRRPERRIHGISQAMAALVEVVRAGRLSYADAVAIVVSLAKLADATTTSRAAVTGQYITQGSMFELARYPRSTRH
jgi:hypothetical protein